MPIQTGETRVDVTVSLVKFAKTNSAEGFTKHPRRTYIPRRHGRQIIAKVAHVQRAGRFARLEYAVWNVYVSHVKPLLLPQPPG